MNSDKENPVLAGPPSAMCSFQNKLYVFFDKAFQTIRFEDGKPISSTEFAAWDHPSNCATQDEYIWITAANGIFTLHFDGEKHRILHAECESFAGVHGLGIFKDNLYAVMDVIKEYDTSSGVIKPVEQGDWSHMICGIQKGNFLYLPSSRGPIWRYNMEKNTCDQVSHGWNTGKAAAFVEDQIFAFAADGIYLVDVEAQTKKQIKKEDCNDVLVCSSLGKDVYAFKKDGTFWKYTMDVIETKIDLEWAAKEATKKKADEEAIKSVPPQEREISAISWPEGNNFCHRLYMIEDGKVFEHCKDGNGDWYLGGVPRIPGSKVLAVKESNHLCVFIQDGTTISKFTYSGYDWEKADFNATGNLLAVTLTPNLAFHVWVENNGAISQWDYINSKWTQSTVKF